MTIAAEPVAAAEVRGTSRIDAVTVFPSGAEVTRLAKVRLAPGEHVVILSDLPAQAIASSIRVEGKATGQLEIGSVDTRRLNVPRTDATATASERRRIELEIERVRDEREIVLAEVQAAEAQKTLITNLTNLPGQPIPLPHGGGTMQQPDWGQLYGLIGTRLAEAQKVILAAQLRVRDLDRRIRDLEGQLPAAAPAEVERTEVKVHVAAGAALEADLTIRYQVPQAGWQPFYDARLATGAKATSTLSLKRN